MYVNIVGMTPKEADSRVLWDTQLVSYAMKGQFVDPPDSVVISSVSAQELFMMQRPDTGVRFGFPTRIDSASFSGNRERGSAGVARSLAHGRDHSLGKGSKLKYRQFPFKDNIVLQLPDGRRIDEALHQTVAEVVNEHNDNALRSWLHGEHHARRATIRLRFNWLTEHEVRCIPLTRDAAQLAQELFADFVGSQMPKARIRNTVNDLLILASAMTSGLPLQTRDKVLANFARVHLEAAVNEPVGDTIRIDPPTWRSPRVMPVSRDRRGSRSTQHHRMGSG
jgi:predicted nucleic acid-binding protein